MARALPSWRWVTADLRCHGESPPRPPPHTLSSCAADAGALLEELGADAVIGHSFGGKVALTMAAESRVPASMPVFVLDSALGVRAPDSPTASLVDAVIQALEEGPRESATRGDMRRALEARGLPPHLVAWLLTSLFRDGDAWRWRYDLAGVRAMMESYHDHDCWGFLEAQAPARTPRIHIVRAGKGGAWTAADQARLASLHAQGLLHHACLDDAGHWLHVDDPEGLMSILSARLKLFTD